MRSMVSEETARPAPRLAADAVHHPVVVSHAEQRAADLQLRIADAITKLAGTMTFVYIHAGVFAVWMLVLENRRGRR